MTSYRVYQGYAEDVIDTFKDNTVDCIFASPYPPQTPPQLQNLLRVFIKCKRVLKKSGRIWVNIPNQWRNQRNGGILHMSEVFVLKMGTEGRYVNRDNMIWWRYPTDKNKQIDPYRFRHDWEDIYSFSHEDSVPYFNDRIGLHGSSIIQCPTEHFKPGEFKSGFPERVIDVLLRVSTRPGDVVMDPYMGTGTTGVVALKLGRHFIGIDATLNKTYRRAVEDRLNKFRYDVQKMQS